MISGRRRVTRIVGVLAAIAVVATIPTLARARPQPADPARSAASVLAGIRASASIGYSGYAQSVGTAGIPDVNDLGDLPALLGNVTMLRVWWGGPGRWRVDKLSATSEDDTYAYPGGSWEWASATRTAVDVTAVAPVRLIRAADLTPDQLGRRLAALAGQGGVTATRDGARRIAGRTALGVVLTGAPGTTVGAVQLWADETTGVPLAASVTAIGQSRPLLSTSYLSFRSGTPSAGTDTFTPPTDATVQSVSDQALRGLLGRLEPLPPAASVAGLTLSDANHDLVFGDGQDASSVQVYGSGLAQVAAVGLSFGDERTLARQLSGVSKTSDTGDGFGRAEIATVSTPLVNLALLESRGLHVLLIGTVPVSTLVTALGDLQKARVSSSN